MIDYKRRYRIDPGIGKDLQQYLHPITNRRIVNPYDLTISKCNTSDPGLDDGQGDREIQVQPLKRD